MLYLWGMAQNRKLVFISKVKSKPHVALNRKLHAFLMEHGAEPQSELFRLLLFVTRTKSVSDQSPPVNEVRFTWDTYPITPYLPYNPMPCFKYYSFVLLNSRCCQIFEMQST